MSKKEAKESLEALGLPADELVRQVKQACARHGKDVTPEQIAGFASKLIHNGHLAQVRNYIVAQLAAAA